MSERYLVSVTIRDTVTGAAMTVNQPVGETLIRYPNDVGKRVLVPAFACAMQALCAEIVKRGGDV